MEWTPEEERQIAMGAESRYRAAKRLKEETEAAAVAKAKAEKEAADTEAAKKKKKGFLDF